MRDRVGTVLVVVVLLLISGGVPGFASQEMALLESLASANPQETAQQQAVQTEQRLRVQVGKSLVINSPTPLSRVSVTDPAIATALIISETQVLIHGERAGSVTLLLWDEQDQVRSFSLNVELNLPELREMISRVFPASNVDLRQTAASIVLSGTVSSPEMAERLVALARTHSESVVNMLSVKERNDMVLLQVRIAEVSRTALDELGLSAFSTGAGNTHGAIGTQQFQTLSGVVGAVPAEVEVLRPPPGSSVAAGAIRLPLHGNPGIFGMTDLLNLFLFRPDVNLGITLKALESRNLLEILAEPNVMALNGKEASFLAGGEFPFPVVQGGANFTAVTIEFREFGVRVNFTPQVLDDGAIRLKVTPEVSALDFANALTVSGFLVPALSTRRAETEVELRDGQSFAIAGLIDNRLIEVASKIPLLGDIPFFGKLFQSRSLSKSNNELVVLVTPTLVAPMDPGQVPPLPEFPKEFLDPKKFDGPAGEAPDVQGSPAAGSENRQEQ